MGQPQVSVVLPVWNGERYLRQAIESILEQDFKNFELVIVNDGSTDGTASILAEYSADERVRVHTQENCGLVAALNTGVELARAGLIARMDADDISLPNRLRLQYAFMEAHPEVAVLGSSITLIDAVGRQRKTQTYPQGPEAVAASMLQGCALAHPAVMMRRAAVIKVGGYRQAFQHAEDYDLWLRIMGNHRIDNLPEALLRYRIHPESVSLVHNTQQALGALTARYAYLRRSAGQPDPFLHQTSPVCLADLAKLNLTESEESEFSMMRFKIAQRQKTPALTEISGALQRAWDLRAHQRRGRLVRHVLMPGAFILMENGRTLAGLGWIACAFLREPLSAAWMLLRQSVKILGVGR
jgi:glycosyltransferase involved in cell wall biosynthesis